jgi:hypothetical protein
MTSHRDQENIILGKWTEEEIDTLLRESWSVDDITSRINFLSARFLDTDYRESTLIGDAVTPEAFVINFRGVDCFTYLDYVEAMRHSRSFSDFRENLRNIRYRSGKVAFEHRNHFFTDWRDFNADLVEDVTSKVANGKEKNVIKRLNQKEDGTHYLPGIAVIERKITYIPSDKIRDDVIDRLHPGDYAGIYSEKEGLDVSHVGIIIKKKNDLFLRHASSSNIYRRVIDHDFRVYMKNKPGIVVLRPKE